MNEKLSLTELQLVIRDSLYLAMPGFFWVTAEIAELRENSAGHCYLELIEKLPEEKNARARIRAVIWNNRYRLLKPFFATSTGSELSDGMKVLVKVKVEYHELYGLSLLINDIDPSYTLGEMALKRQMIINRLQEDGVIGMNKELQFPFVPQRIAVISSSKAAGYQDFTQQLKLNQYGYVFYTALFESAMQGEETESGITGALDRIADNLDKFDVVAIIRGGGSQADLSWFDNYNIAFHITQFPIPVLAGIGHEKDISVTDLVAYKSLKTPTAVADFLVESVAGSEAVLMDMIRDISDYASDILTINKDRIESARHRIIPAAKILLSDEKEKLSDFSISIISSGKDLVADAGLTIEKLKASLQISGKYLIAEKERSVTGKKADLRTACFNNMAVMKNKTAMLENSIRILDPANVLRRGFTITSKGGKILKSSEGLTKDDLIETTFSDGSKRSKII